MSTARLGPYRLLHQVGGGGMGVVHLALDPSSRAVAIKVLRPHLAADPAARERLAREGDTLRLVRSPRVAEVLETAADADPPYIVTQYVAAPPLDEHVALHGALSGAPLARLGLGLGEALAAIHRAGVVHRDLKPGNVLIDDDGPVVIDFGIAQIADDVRLTSSGLVMGTPGYLSPEVIDGAPVSFAGDWWGWAATMLFAATGRPPFGTGPLEAVLSRVHRGVPDLAGVEEPFAALLRAATSPDPADRPTPRRLREALSGVLAGSDDDGETQHPGEPAAPGPVPVPVPSAAGSTVLLAEQHADPGPASDPAPAAEVDGSTRALPVAAGAGRGDETALLDPGPRYGGAPTALVAVPRAEEPYRVEEPHRAEEPYLVDVPYQVDVPDHGYPPQPLRDEDQRPEDHVAPGGRSGSEVDAAPPSPARVRGRAWIPLLLSAAVSVTAGLVPVRVCVALVVASVVLRVVDRSADGLQRRRWGRGPRGSDGVLTALALPAHLLAAAFVTVVALVLPALMGVSAAFITGWALNPSGAPIPGSGLALAVGCAVAVLTAWWGPGGASLRRGTRLVVRAATPRQPAVAIGAGLAALVLLAALLVLGGDGQPSWAPLDGPPLGIGGPLG